MDDSITKSSGAKETIVGQTLLEKSAPLPFSKSTTSAVAHGDEKLKATPLSSFHTVADKEEEELQRAIRESAMVAKEDAPPAVLDGDEELQRAIKESEREARLAYVARARE